MPSVPSVTLTEHHPSYSTIHVTTPCAISGFAWHVPWSAYHHHIYSINHSPNLAILCLIMCHAHTFSQLFCYNNIVLWLQNLKDHLNTNIIEPFMKNKWKTKIALLVLDVCCSIILINYQYLFDLRVPCMNAAAVTQHFSIMMVNHLLLLACC